MARDCNTVLTNKEYYKVRTSPQERGKDIHTCVYTFKPLNKSEFCVSCHQVAVQPGHQARSRVGTIPRFARVPRRASPARIVTWAKRRAKTTASTTGAAAVIDGTSDQSRIAPRHNHMFIGPGYPIAHPGIFPHHPDAGQYSLQTWLKFDYRAGWGK